MRRIMQRIRKVGGVWEENEKDRRMRDNEKGKRRREEGE